MASAARRRSPYGSPRATYGNVAYDLAYAEPARTLEPGGAEVLRPRPKARPREKAAVRPKVQVREAGHVSIFAVVGFLAVGVFAALLLLSYVELTVAGASVADLKQELKTLQSEEAKLQAQYEMAYDLSTIEQKVTADGSMVKPRRGRSSPWTSPSRTAWSATRRRAPWRRPPRNCWAVWKGFLTALWHISADGAIGFSVRAEAIEKERQGVRKCNFLTPFDILGEALWHRKRGRPKTAAAATAGPIGPSWAGPSF